MTAALPSKMFYRCTVRSPPLQVIESPSARGELEKLSKSHERAGLHLGDDLARWFKVLRGREEDSS